jgi:serine protease Do
MAQDELTAIVSGVEPSVVGILGKVSRLSKSYYEASENIVMGSGIVYRSNGYIITNCHVVEECDTLLVILSDKKVYEARVIGKDEGSDLALIKVEKGMLKPVGFADSSDVQVGASVITIGTPLDFSLHNSVGLGIVSGINRGNLGFTEYQFIQTDAVANPGNSGGPLVDIDGKVLGIVEGGFMSYSGISFCIPSETIEYVVPQLMRYGRVMRPEAGAELTQGITADYGLPSGQGLFFTHIDKEGPCAKAGITEEDVLISINGARVNTFSEYTEVLKNYMPGDTVTLVVSRDGKNRDVKLTFADSEK